MYCLMMRIALLWSILTVCYSRCPPNVLVLYRAILHTEWSEKNFPKQYPTWRPPAQWSVSVGRSHNSSNILWRLGKAASDSLKVFVETGKADMLISEGKSRKVGILSEFFASPIPQGVGLATTQFFADDSHSQVSIISRLIPSPDWFIGVDSYELCKDGQWVDQVNVDLDPIDGGTDDGFTFTAPNWATDPRSTITLINSSYPDHPSSSFFYSELRKLPRIAFITFLKLKEFILKKHGNFKGESWNERNNTNFRKRSSTIENAERFQYKLDNTNREKKNSVLYVKEINGLHSKVETPVRTEALIVKKHRNRRKPCRVSQWSEWEECDRRCEFGKQFRRRNMTRSASRNGQPCPPLEEARRCRNMTSCENQTIGFFRWA